jgi:hypothetical protein
VSDELKLIDAAKGGSVDAFTELVHGYREGLLRFLLTRCSSHADAEDALQDTLINAYRYIGSYNPPRRRSACALHRRFGARQFMAQRQARPVGRGVCGDVAALRRGYVGARYRKRSRAIVIVDQGQSSPGPTRAGGRNERYGRQRRK